MSKIIKINRPVKKNGLFISKVTNENNSNYRIKISLTKFVSLNKIPASGDLLKIWLNPNNQITSDTINILKDIDNQVLDIIKKYNNQWFKNELDEDEIINFFRPSFNLNSNILSVLNASVHQSIIIYNNNIIDSLYDVDFTNTTIDIELEIQGLYFFQKKCGIRWVVNKIVIVKISDDNFEDVIDRRAIEDTWENDLETFNTHIDDSCNRLMEKINRLEKFRKEINDTYNSSKNLNIDKSWNNLLKNLSKRISKYYEGILELQ